MATTAAAWRLATARNDPDHPLHQLDLTRGDRTVHRGDLGAEIGGGYMVAVVGGLLNARGDGPPRPRTRCQPWSTHGRA